MTSTSITPPDNAAMARTADKTTSDKLIAWVIDGLTKTGKSRTGLAAALGLNPTVVTRITQGKRRINADEIPIIENYLGSRPPGRAAILSNKPISVPVVGDIGDTIWYDKDHVFEPSRHSRLAVVVSDRTYKKFTQRSLHISDDSFNLMIPNGADIVYVNYWKARQQLEGGDIVVYEHHDIGNNRKRLILRRVVKFGDGFQLRPESRHPQDFETIDVPRDHAWRKYFKKRIIGKVIGYWAGV